MCKFIKNEPEFCSLTLEYSLIFWEALEWYFLEFFFYPGWPVKTDNYYLNISSGKTFYPDIQKNKNYSAGSTNSRNNKTYYLNSSNSFVIKKIQQMIVVSL